jgi:hypothetical protein
VDGNVWLHGVGGAERMHLGNESRDYGNGAGLTFDRLTTAVLELDPTFVKTVEHPHAGPGVFHTLQAEPRGPQVSAYRPRMHRLSDDGGEGVGKVIRRYATGALQLDDPDAGLILLNEVCRHTPNVLRGDHRKDFARWL